MPRGDDDQRTAYIGKELDTESELGDHGVRKVDYELGRFTTIDPLWEKFYSWSPYQYSMNNPVSLADEDGEVVGIMLTGFIIGAIIDGGVEYMSQMSGGNIFDFDSYDFNRKADGYSIVGKAFRGGTFGAFGGIGAAAVKQGAHAGWLLVYGGAGNWAGGVGDRCITGNKDPLAADEQASDAVSGSVGMLGGYKAINSKIINTIKKNPTIEYGANKIMTGTINSAEEGVGKVINTLATSISDAIFKDSYQAPGLDYKLQFSIPNNIQVQDNTRDNTNYIYPSK